MQSIAHYLSLAKKNVEGFNNISEGGMTLSLPVRGPDYRKKS